MGEKTASQASTPEATSSSHVKPLLDGYDSDLNQMEWVVANADGKILCTRLADIAWVRAVGDGVELRIGQQTYLVQESFASWQAKLPAKRFALRGNSLLVNVRRLKRLGAALSAVFPQPRAGWSPPSSSEAWRNSSRR